MKLQVLPRTRSLVRFRNKQTLTETDIESTCGKLSPQEFQSQKKRKQIRKKTQTSKQSPLKKKQIFHERIHRFHIKGTKRTMRIYEYKQSDLGWPKKFTKQLCPQEMDNDVESDSEIIQQQVEKCKRYLFQEFQARKVASSKASSPN